MPNPLNAVRGEQWRDCDRCGERFPSSDLTKEKGLIICHRCADNFEIERHPFTVAEILGANDPKEGSDRLVDLYMMPDRSETEYL